MVWDRIQSRDSGHFWLYQRTEGAFFLAGCPGHFVSPFPTRKLTALLPSWVSGQVGSGVVW